MFLLFMLPAVDEVPEPPAPVAAEANVPTYNGAPIPLALTGRAEHVTVVGPDGFTVGYDPASLGTERASDADLCQQLQEVKPWIDWGCE